MKKLLALALTLSLLFSAISIISVSAEYDPSDNLVSGDYKYEILEDGTAAFNGYIGIHEKFTVPEEIEGLKVTKIHRLAFAEKKNLKSVTIPEGVTYIGFDAFAGCTNLEEINLPDSLQNMHYMYIDQSAYYRNPDNWENGVLYVSNHLVDTDPKKISGTFEVKEGTVSITMLAFDGCKDLTEVVLPDSLKYIGGSAFRDCDTLTKINLHDNITLIDRYAFSNCPLTEIHIPNGITTIEGGAFRGTLITEITIPTSVERIGDSVFQNCDGLTEITIPETVKVIDDYAFLNCENLASVTLPESLDNLGYAVFSGTAYANDENNWEDGLLYYKDMLLDSKGEISGNVNIKDGTRIIAANAFGDNDNIDSVNISQSVEIIGRGCFSACENLKSVKLSNNITEIPSRLFSGCLGLENFTIPENVKAIGDNAFFNCLNLKYIVIPESVENFGTDSVGYYNPYYGDGSAIPLEYSKVEDLVIAGYKGTAAEKYAKEHGFTFEDLSAPTVYKYKDRVLELLEISENENDSIHLAHYNEEYENEDFALIKVYSNMFLEADFTYYFGDYTMYEENTSAPARFGYVVYIPKENKLYSLVEAYEQNVQGLDAVFKAGILGNLTGDVNFDLKLNVRDATLLQKHIAGLESYYENYNIAKKDLNTTHADKIADFNKDGKVNVRDATAIQKRIAGYKEAQ
ncbi:MAG: leucine-rich repeat protein [Clostridia bacterium]|nr:leucine-rich repeat protein [Clostridia bacterium]